VAIGLVAGYSRNWLDDVLMRGVDVLLAFPQLVLVLLFVSMIGPKAWLITVLVGISWVPGVARVARGMTLETVKREFVEASEALGVPRRRILTRDILPMLMTTVMVEFGLRLTWSIALISAISFLGFGIQAPNADWGLMVNENRVALAQQVWATLAPIICIATFAIGTNLVTEGIGRAVAGIDRRGGHGGR
jgi:peptide/nickel transport system permease protein